MSEYEFYCDFETNCHTMFLTNPEFANVGKATSTPGTGPSIDATFPTGIK